jgi:hypothetical protein
MTPASAESERPTGLSSVEVKRFLWKDCPPEWVELRRLVWEQETGLLPEDGLFNDNDHQGRGGFRSSSPSSAWCRIHSTRRSRPTYGRRTFSLPRLAPPNEKLRQAGHAIESSEAECLAIGRWRRQRLNSRDSDEPPGKPH